MNACPYGPILICKQYCNLSRSTVCFVQLIHNTYQHIVHSVLYLAAYHSYYGMFTLVCP